MREGDRTSQTSGGRTPADARVKIVQTFSWSFVLFCDSLSSVNYEQVIRKRDRLLAQLPEGAEILRGSLLQRTIRHRTGCPKCERGEGHPVSVLAVGYPGRMRQISLRKHQVADVKRSLENYYRLKAALEEICEINLQLLRLKPKEARQGKRGQ